MISSFAISIGLIDKEALIVYTLSSSISTSSLKSLYPIKETITLYLPFDTLSILYTPFASHDAPNSSPSTFTNNTFAP